MAKYRVKVVIDNSNKEFLNFLYENANNNKVYLMWYKFIQEEFQQFNDPLRKYMIQKRIFWYFWEQYSEPVMNKKWAYETCEELNTPYKKMKDTIVNKFKFNMI